MLLASWTSIKQSILWSSRVILSPLLQPSRLSNGLQAMLQTAPRMIQRSKMAPLCSISQPQRLCNGRLAGLQTTPLARAPPPPSRNLHPHCCHHQAGRPSHQMKLALFVLRPLPHHPRYSRTVSGMWAPAVHLHIEKGKRPSLQCQPLPPEDPQSSLNPRSHRIHQPRVPECLQGQRLQINRLCLKPCSTLSHQQRSR